MIKKILLTLLLVVTFPFCRAQDTARYTSIRQQQRLGEAQITDTLYGKFDIALYHDDKQKRLSICRGMECAKYSVDTVMGFFQNEDSTLLQFSASKIPSNGEVYVRVMLKGEDIIMVGIVTPWSIIYYEVIKKPEESKL